MLYIAIGRNVGRDVGSPMPTKTWLQFQRDTIRAVGRGEPNTVTWGKSDWQGDTEETAVFVWFDIKSIGDLALGRLRGVAQLYWQDAIAYSVSETRFIEGGN